jgi:exosortase
MASLADPLPKSSTASTAAPVPWMAIVWFTVLLGIVYFPIFSGLVWQWTNDEDVGHGFFVPVIAGFIAWQRREQILAAEYRPARWGVLLLIWGAAQAYIGTAGAELFLQRTSILITLVGMLLVFGGTKLVRMLAFPLLLLPFMIPIPGVVYNQLTFPLQLLASNIAANVLELLDIPVLRDGNILTLASQQLSVAEACSGIRSLMSLSFLSLVYAYFFDSKVWMRWVLLLATVPIAILANAGRVTMTGWLSENVSPQATKGVFHSLEGWIVFVIDLVMLFFLHRLINWVWRRTRGTSTEAQIA